MAGELEDVVVSGLRHSCFHVEFIKGKRSWLLYQSLFGVLQACRCYSSQFASDEECLLPVASYYLYQAGVCRGFVAALGGALL